MSSYTKTVILYTALLITGVTFITFLVCVNHNQSKEFREYSEFIEKSIDNR